MRMFIIRSITVAALFLSFITPPASACRYNVRDTGFVDLGTESYRLYGYINRNTPADIASAFEQLSHAVLTDSNINFEIINTDQQKDHPAIKYLDLHPRAFAPAPVVTQAQVRKQERGQSFPAAVLLSPDSQSLFVPVTKPNQPFKRTLWLALEDIVSSPKRDQIVRQVIETYAVILLAEGTDPQENKKARQAAVDAIDTISRQMKFLPKAIAQPPVLVVVDRQSFSTEKVLLWSLGLDVDKLNEPCAAVIYGRARWIGPLMKGKQITEATLVNILYVIGTDCECGLDIRWTQGTALPVRWDEKTQAKVAKNLGFDPENPMVKMEISRILRMGAASYPGVPLAYQELVVEFDSDSNSEFNEPAIDIQDTPPPQPIAVKAKPIPEPSVSAETEPTLKKPLYLIAGLAVLIIAVGLFIAVRAARKNQ